MTNLDERQGCNREAVYEYLGVQHPVIQAFLACGRLVREVLTLVYEIWKFKL